MDLGQNSKTQSLTAAWRRYAFCLAIILASCPLLTHEELTADSMRLPVVAEVTGNGEKLSNWSKEKTTIPDGFGNSAAMTMGNATLENIGESLFRLEENLASLIQSFLTVQRSVFNLEQLQEVLVLLLEDILKQTSSADKIPSPDANPTNRGGGSGSTSLFNDSNDNDNADIASNENEDGVDDRDVVSDLGDNADVAVANELHKGQGAGDDLAMSRFRSTHGLSRDHNIASAKQVRDSISGARTDDSAGGSSEGGGSNSNEDVSGYRAAMQQSPRPADFPLSISQKPHWAEPVIAHVTTNNHNRFLDVVQRIASRLGQPALRNSSPRLLGLMQMASTSHVEKAESTFDRPPVSEPLEMIPAQESSGITKNKIHQKMRPMLPLKIKLRQESVISHGGPLSGPEHRSSPFFEHPEDHQGIESSGERPTGMINNLVQANISRTTISVTGDGHSPVVDVAATSTQSVDQIPVLDIRRKRHTHNYSLNIMKAAGTKNPAVLMGSGLYGREHQSDRSITNDTTTATNVNVLSIADTVTSAENSVNITQHNFTVSNDDSIHPSFSGEDPLDKETEQSNTPTSEGGQDYDVLIASLLTDLSTQLHQQHVKETQNDDSTGDVVNRVVSELNKLIWIPTNEIGHSPDGFESTTARTDKVAQLSVITKSFNKTLLYKFKDNSSGHSNATRASDHTKIHAYNKMSNNYAISAPDGAIKKGTTASDRENNYTLHADGIFTATEMTGTQNVTDNINRGWDWLSKLIDIAEFPAVDLEWLTDALTQLSQNESFAEDLRVLNDRGRDLLERKSFADGLGNSFNAEIDIKIEKISNDVDKNFDDDPRLSSMEDNSASSEDDDGKVDKNIIEVGKAGPHERGFDAVSETDNNHINNNDGHNDNADNSGLDIPKDKENSDESDEDEEKSDNIRKGDQNGNRETVQEKGYTLTNTDYFLDESTPAQRQISRMQAQFKVPHTRLLNTLPPHNGQASPKAQEFLYRQPRAIKHISDPAISLSEAQRENERNKTSHNRQKRQTDMSRNKVTRTIPETQHFPIHQQTNAHPEQRTKIGGAYTNQKEISISLERQQSTKNSENVSQNSTLNSIDAGGISSPHFDLNHPVSMPPSGRQYSQNNSAGSQNSHQTNSHNHGQRTSDLHSFLPPLSGYPTIFDNLGFNNPHFDSLGSSNHEPGETPSAEERSALDLEEILTNLFLTYWQRFYNLYTRSVPPTTTPADWDYEEEITVTTFTTTALPALTTASAEHNITTSEDPSLTGSSNVTSAKADNVG